MRLNGSTTRNLKGIAKTGIHIHIYHRTLYTPTLHSDIDGSQCDLVHLKYKSIQSKSHNNDNINDNGPLLCEKIMFILTFDKSSTKQLNGLSNEPPNLLNNNNNIISDSLFTESYDINNLGSSSNAERIRKSLTKSPTKSPITIVPYSNKYIYTNNKSLQQLASWTKNDSSPTCINSQIKSYLDTTNSRHANKYDKYSWKRCN